MPSDAFTVESRRAEYAARFNRVVDYIQEHLPEPMDLDTLAGVACFSPYHFHRLFHGWMGETIHHFIFRLRVERAAVQLVYNPKKSITEIALDCGFSSSATFARAFKSFHGLSASEWRKNRNIRNTDRKICKVEASGGIASSGSGDESGPPREQAMKLTVQVKRLPPLVVAYVRHVGPFQENAALFQRLFGRICAWAGPRGLLGQSSARFLSVHHDYPDITQAQNLRLDAALTVPEDTQVHGEISRQRLEGGLYAIARLQIHAKQYMAAWDAFMGEWLPSSGYQPDDRPCFEIYLNEPWADPECLHEVEICLAVKPL